MEDSCQVLPLGRVTGKYPSGNKYPDYVKVPMSDGKVLTYVLSDQPHPAFLDAMDGIRRMVVGYETKK